MSLVALAVPVAVMDAPEAPASRAEKVVGANTLLVDARALIVAIVLAAFNVAERSTPSRLADAPVRDAMSMRAAIDLTASTSCSELLAVVSEEGRVTNTFAGRPVADPVVIAAPQYSVAAYRCFFTQTSVALFTVSRVAAVSSL
jgi:hypothetical protein